MSGIRILSEVNMESLMHLTTMLMALRAAAPSVRDEDDPKRVEILKKIAALQESEQPQTLA